VHWCRRRVRFNEVPEKVPKVPKVRFNLEKVPEKVWEALVQSQVRFKGAKSASTGFRRRKVPVKVREALVQSRVRSNRVPEKVPEKV